MPNKIDLNADTHERHRRNWQRLARGAALSTITVNAPITNSSGIGLSLASAGGLETSSGSLQINLDSNPGLTLSASGLKVLLPSSSGLQLAAGGLSIDLDSDPGLVLGAGGIKILLNGSTLTLGASGLSVTAGGIGLTQLGALTTKGDILTHSGAAHARLGVGTDGHVLTADSTAANGIKWAASSGGGSSSPLTTKGDLWTYSTVDDRLDVGTDGQILTANSSETTGLEWVDPALIEDGVVIGETPTGTIDGSNDEFVTASTPAADSLAVYLNGIRLTETEDYTVAADTITFDAGSIPATGDTLRVDYVIDGSTGGGGGGGSLPTQTGNSGKFLTTDGSTASWGTPSRTKVFAESSDGSAVGASTTTETNLSAGTSLAANSLAVGDQYRITLDYTQLNGSGTRTFKIYFGSNSISTGVMGSNGTKTSRIVVDVRVSAIGSSGTWDGFLHLAESATSNTLVNTGGIAIDTTASMTIKATITFSSSSGTNSITLRQFIVEKL